MYTYHGYLIVSENGGYSIVGAKGESIAFVDSFARAQRIVQYICNL